MKTRRSKTFKVALTTGDENGIGFEVCAKALLKLAPLRKKTGAVFFLFRKAGQEKIQPRYFKDLDAVYERVIHSSLTEALDYVENRLAEKNLRDNVLIDLSLKISPAEWVVVAARACANGTFDSLVTGPLSKKLSATLPRKPLGHTGIFRNLFPDSPMHMAFVGPNFNVLLATDHIPFSAVSKHLLSGKFNSSLESARRLRALLRDRRKIAVLGLNPHAGEGGLIGDIENKLFRTLDIKNFDGPLVPDAAFLKKNLKKYSLFVCMYHDQGLIPFKSHHGQDSGVHITMGLPFIRTSVDHGTAIDLFNKNLANENSMLAAIKMSLQLLGVKNV